MRDYMGTITPYALPLVNAFFFFQFFFSFFLNGVCVRMCHPKYGMLKLFAF